MIIGKVDVASLQTCYISLLYQLRPVLITTKETHQLKNFYSRKLLGTCTEIFGKVDVVFKRFIYL